jgi:hypothetical protein
MMISREEARHTGKLKQFLAGRLTQAGDKEALSRGHCSTTGKPKHKVGEKPE